MRHRAQSVRVFHPIERASIRSVISGKKFELHLTAACPGEAFGGVPLHLPPRDELRAALGEDFARTALTESIAEAGEGIRETFVLAVWLALDRIRELMAQGLLPRGRPAIDTAEQLLAALERQPAAPAPGDIASAVMSVVPAARPRLPDARVPSGAIWPPVEGRMVLHEATAGDLALHRLGSGDWLAGIEAAAFDAGELLDRLAAAAATLGEAHARCADRRLPPTLDTIGRGARGAQFVALMPGPSAAPLPRPTDVGGHIARELARMLAADLVERRSELAQRVTHRRTSPTPWDDVVAAAIADRVPSPPANVAPRGSPPAQCETRVEMLTTGAAGGGGGAGGGGAAATAPPPPPPPPIIIIIIIVGSVWFLLFERFWIELVICVSMVVS